MIETLYHSFSLAEKPVKKEQLIKTFNTVISLLREDVLPSLDGIVEIEKKNRDISKSQLVATTITCCKIVKVPVKNLFKDTQTVFLSIDKNANKIEDLISKHGSSVLTNRALTMKDAAILKLVDDIASMVLFTMDFIVCVLGEINETSFPKIKFKKCKESIPAFVELLGVYQKDITKTITEITKLDDTIINKDANASMLDAKLNNDGIRLNTTKGFLGNPFYHIRMWLVDRDMRKLEDLKEKKKLTELRLMELRVKDASGSDGDLSKQIEYYEEKISSLEYEIQKLEEV